MVLVPKHCRRLQALSTYSTITVDDDRLAAPVAFIKMTPMTKSKLSSPRCARKVRIRSFVFGWDGGDYEVGVGVGIEGSDVSSTIGGYSRSGRGPDSGVGRDGRGKVRGAHPQEHGDEINRRVLRTLFHPIPCMLKRRSIPFRSLRSRFSAYGWALVSR